MADITASSTDIAPIIVALSHLGQPLALTLVGCTVFALVIALLIWRQIKKDQLSHEERTEKGKAERAQLHAEAMKALASAVASAGTQHKAAADEIKGAVTDLKSSVVHALQVSAADTRITLGAMTESFGTLTRKQDENTTAIKQLIAQHKGSMSEDDSSKLIHYEWDALKKATSGWFESSLEKNHYTENPTRVENKVREQLTKMFDRAQAKLNSFDLALPLAPYFPQVDRQFTIINKLWEAVRPLYLKKDDQTRFDEMADIVSRVFREDMARAEEEGADIYAESNSQKGTRRVPESSSATYPAYTETDMLPAKSA